MIFHAGPAHMKRQRALVMGSFVSGLGSFLVTTDLGAATDLDFLTRVFWVSSSGTGRYLERMACASGVKGPKYCTSLGVRDCYI